MALEGRLEVVRAEVDVLVVEVAQTPTKVEAMKEEAEADFRRLVGYKEEILEAG